MTTTIGHVSFIGAGPGAADLITLRGAKRLAEADIVVWAASLVDPECVREHARADAEIVDSSLITHEDVLDIYRRAAASRLRVARVHSGDPSLWGAVQEQYDACVRLGLEVEIVPGVSAFSAAAAVAGRELTLPEVAQSVILTRLEGGKTPMPDGEHIREFARHGTTMAIFLSAARSGQLVDELRAGGYADDTPVVIAYKATWPDELILHTTIGELSATVKQHKLWRHTLFLVGRALRSGGTRSHLYHAGHFHSYRKADPAARKSLREDGASAGGSSPLQTSRSGWVAARISDGWSSRRTTANGSSEASAAAWSAVRGWQETARAGGRGGARQRSAESRRSVAPDQGALELAQEPESGPATRGKALGLAPEPQGESNAAGPETVQARAAAPGRPELVPSLPEPEVARAGQVSGLVSESGGTPGSSAAESGRRGQPEPGTAALGLVPEAGSVTVRSGAAEPGRPGLGQAEPGSVGAGQVPEAESGAAGPGQVLGFEAKGARAAESDQGALGLVPELKSGTAGPEQSAPESKIPASGARDGQAQAGAESGTAGRDGAERKAAKPRPRTAAKKPAARRTNAKSAGKSAGRKSAPKAE